MTRLRAFFDLGDNVTEDAVKKLYFDINLASEETIMTTNVGTIDRIFRAALGAILLYLAFFSGIPAFDGSILKYGVAIVGIVMLVVAAVRMCPIYSIFGIKTCRM